MKNFLLVLVLVLFALENVSVAVDTSFGSLNEAKQAALKDVEPDYIVDLNKALYTNKLLPYAKTIDLKNERNRLLYLLTMRSYNSLTQITGQRTAILYFFKDTEPKLSFKKYKAEKIAQASRIKGLEQDDNRCSICCCLEKDRQNKLKSKEDPSSAAQDAAMAAGLNDAAWNAAWLYGGDPWGPSWDLANSALITYFDNATNVANSQIEKALVDITDPIQQGRIAYRVAEWVALNYYYAKATEMLGIVNNILAKNLPNTVKNPTANPNVWWKYRSAYFTPLRPISYVYVTGWLAILDEGLRL